MYNILLSEEEKVIRQQILEAGIEATTKHRNASYGDPLSNLGLAGRIKSICRQFEGSRTIGPAEWEALDLVITKLSRIVVGGEIKRDNYIDGAAYFAIAGELAEREIKEAFAKQEAKSE